MELFGNTDVPKNKPQIPNKSALNVFPWQRRRSLLESSMPHSWSRITSVNSVSGRRKECLVQMAPQATPLPCRWVSLFCCGPPSCSNEQRMQHGYQAGWSCCFGASLPFRLGWKVCKIWGLRSAGPCPVTWKKRRKLRKLCVRRKPWRIRWAFGLVFSEWVNLHLECTTLDWTYGRIIWLNATPYQNIPCTWKTHVRKNAKVEFFFLDILVFYLLGFLFLTEQNSVMAAPMVQPKYRFITSVMPPLCPLIEQGRKADRVLVIMDHYHRDNW